MRAKPAVHSVSSALLAARAAGLTPTATSRVGAVMRSHDAWFGADAAPMLLPHRENGDRAAFRERAGLALFAGDDAARFAAAERMHAVLSQGYAPRTNKGDDGHWRAWEKVCKNLGTSPWRTDVQANLGIDPEGHQEEVFLCVSAIIQMYAEMMPRRRSDPAADPRSANKKIEGVRRRHLTVKGITMVSSKVINLAVKGLCREYIDKYGVDTLVPERKLPFTSEMVAAMLLTLDGTTRGELTVNRDEYFWKAMLACFATLAEEGSRKDEVAKESAKAPFRKGRFTFDSLRFKLGGKTVRNPSRAALLCMQPGDGVLLLHGISKNDPFGSFFAATPSFLAYRGGGERCACTALVEMWLAADVPEAERATTPLFGPSPGQEFTHA